MRIDFEHVELSRPHSGLYRGMHSLFLERHQPGYRHLTRPPLHLGAFLRASETDVEYGMVAVSRLGPTADDLLVRGMCTLHALNRLDRYAYISLARRAAWEVPELMEWEREFVDKCFALLDLRKLYFELEGPGAWLAEVPAPFVLEGVLSEDVVLANGERLDVAIFCADASGGAPLEL